jgi:VIT1/CCC1 family predicted Fe2+/Mn2+ transporter
VPVDHHLHHAHDLLDDHTPEAVERRLAQGPSQAYLRDFIYGAVDGIVTTFAVVAGVAGAQLSAGIVIVLGVANLLGDGFSMAVSNYLGTRADEQLRSRRRASETDHIRRYPEGEKEEVRQIFAAKGFEGTDLDRVVEVITANEGRWVDTMITEEFGLSLDGPNPMRAAGSTLVAFIAAGSVPLAIYVWQISAPDPARIANPFFWSSVLTAATFFGVGALKSRFVDERWWRAGIETLLVGGAAAGIAFVVGVALRGLADNA